MSMQLPIYLDYHSTTPVDQRVVDAMLPYFTKSFGNASSKSHCFGWKAEFAVEAAREQVAKILTGASSREIIFTAGATEGNNLALKGIAECYAPQGKHIITSSVEHKCILDTAKYLERKGFEITLLPVDAQGQVSVESVRQAIRNNTILISVMLANNEVGTINPIAAIGKLARENNIFFHTDAAQAVGKVAIDVNAMNIDMLSLSAHKMYGPKGVGAFYVRRREPRVELEPLLHGGGQEHGLRSGTLNVPSIVGLGKACELALAEFDHEVAHLKELRDRLENGLKKRIPNLKVNGHPTERLPNNLNVSFPYIEGDSLVASVKNIAISSTSACMSTAQEPSYVLKSMGVKPELIQAAVRFGLGRFTTAKEIDYTIDTVTAAVEKLQKASPLHQLQKQAR